MPESEHVSAAAIVVAGGTGERFGAHHGKQLAKVAGLPVLSHTLGALDQVEAIGLIIVVCHPDRIEEYRSASLDPITLETPYVLVAGGSTRTDSVRNGLAAVTSEWPYVVVHDGARPLVLASTVESALKELVDHEGVAGIAVGQPSYDTIKEVEDGRVLSTPDRSRFWVVQTPQVFRAESLRAAYSAPLPAERATDDASLVEASGGLVRLVEGPRDNIKVTVPEDLAIVEAVLRYREGGVSAC